MRRLRHLIRRMTHPSIPALAALLLFLGLSPAGAEAASPADAPHAAPVSALGLPGCATVHATGLRAGGGPGGTGFEAERADVLLPAAPDAMLHAARLHADGHGAGLSDAVLEQAATAAAAAVLVALSGRHDACPDATLRGATDPLAHALAHGGTAGFTWSGVAIRAGNTRLGARRLFLRLDGTGPAARLTVALDGAVSNEAAAGLLPETLAVHASMPADQLSVLLSSPGHPSAPVEVTIEQADARRGDTTLSGHGRGTVGPDPEQGSGEGHVTAHNLDTLLDAANASGLGRLRTALFLVKLVAHRQGDQADWDLALQQGVLTINNVPLPMR